MKSCPEYRVVNLRWIRFRKSERNGFVHRLHLICPSVHPFPLSFRPYPVDPDVSQAEVGHQSLRVPDGRTDRPLGFHGRTNGRTDQSISVPVYRKAGSGSRVFQVHYELSCSNRALLSYTFSGLHFKLSSSWRLDGLADGWMNWRSRALQCRRMLCLNRFRKTPDIAKIQISDYSAHFIWEAAACLTPLLSSCTNDSLVVKLFFNQDG